MLAIVIPYYKLSFFEATLRSLANQTNKNFTVYVGNDASTEDPKSLIDVYSKRLNLVYHKFEDNLGKTALTKQWERCIDLTKSEEWLMVLGDDDCLREDVVNSFYKQQSSFKSKTNLIRFASQMVDENGIAKSEIYTHPVWEKSTDAFYRKHKGLTRSSLSEYIFKKESFLEHKFSNYPLAWHSDDRAWLDFSGKLPLYTINEALVFIRLSSESISGKNDNLESKRKAASKFYQFLVDEKRGELSKSQQIEIVKSYFERTVAIRHLSFKEWCFLWIFYLKNTSQLSFSKFFKTFIKSIFKNYSND